MLGTAFEARGFTIQPPSKARASAPDPRRPLAWDADTLKQTVPSARCRCRFSHHSSALACAFPPASPREAIASLDGSSGPAVTAGRRRRGWKPIGCLGRDRQARNARREMTHSRWRASHRSNWPLDVSRYAANSASNRSSLVAALRIWCATIWWWLHSCRARWAGDSTVPHSTHGPYPSMTVKRTGRRPRALWPVVQTFAAALRHSVKGGRDARAVDPRCPSTGSCTARSRPKVARLRQLPKPERNMKAARSSRSRRPRRVARAPTV
jgi:hypothetical protein